MKSKILRYSVNTIVLNLLVLCLLLFATRNLLSIPCVLPIGAGITLSFILLMGFHLLWRFNGHKMTSRIREIWASSGSQDKCLVTLYQLLITCFNKGELSDLCFRLGIDMEQWSDSGKPKLVEEIVLYLVRRNQIPELVETGRSLRPMQTWPDCDSSNENSSSSYQILLFNSRLLLYITIAISYIFRFFERLHPRNIPNLLLVPITLLVIFISVSASVPTVTPFLAPETPPIVRKFLVQEISSLNDPVEHTLEGLLNTSRGVESKIELLIEGDGNYVCTWETDSGTIKVIRSCTITYMPNLTDNSNIDFVRVKVQPSCSSYSIYTNLHVQIN